MTTNQVLEMIAILSGMAFMIETMVEALVGKPIDEFPKVAKYKQYILSYLAVAIGITGAWIYQFDLIYLLAGYMNNMFDHRLAFEITPFGITATGFALGMGSSYLHDFFGRYILKQKEVKTQ